MITIKDVARAAGVSVATVSRVYTGSDRVREETRVHVWEVAGRLGYAPHGTARSLITSRTSTIGVLLPDLYGEFFSEVIRGIDQTAQREGYHLLVSSAHAEQSAVEAALRSMRGRVDGLIIMSPGHEALAPLANLPANFPVVLLNSAGGTDQTDSITVANADGARTMVRHLISLGHRRIAVLRGSPGNFDAAERLRGYREALTEAGISPRPRWELEGNFSEASGYAAAEAILAQTDRPTALFAANDSMAIGALAGFRRAGLTVPGDMAVAGFDDIPLSRYMDPPLTSVHVDISALGERATARLLAGMDRDPARERIREVLPVTLVVRRSCGGVPMPDATGRSAAGSHFNEREAS
ncbi:MAG TPA: LacI family DNA-binding transcriptional regulator [Gemmatimonadales bacterium]|nr:LacI family DNA-binding transcriptional regulator [Gemmatimonadales bacterium]